MHWAILYGVGIQGGNFNMEYTQEQIDKMLADAIAEAKKGLYDEKDLQREIDRRVESGIQKGLETNRKKWEEEFSKKAQLTAEELAKKELEEKMKEFSEREKEVKKKSNLINARELLSEAGVPKSKYEELLEVLVSEDEEITKANVERFANIYTSTKTELETEIKKQYINVPSPTVGNGDKVVTKDVFDKMNYSEKMAFKQTYPEKYSEFVK